MPLEYGDWYQQQGFDPSEELSPTARRNRIYGTEDSKTGSYAGYLEEINQQMFGDITDPYGNIWTSPGSGYRILDEEGQLSLTGGAAPADDLGIYSDLIQGLQFQNEYGANYVPQVIANQMAARANSGGGWLKNWLNGPGPVMALISLFTAGAASGFGTGYGAAGGTLSAADTAGLQQMALDAGMTPGTAAYDAFISSAGTAGSTAANTAWWSNAKTLAKAFSGNLTSGLTGDVVPFDLGDTGSAVAEETVTDTIGTVAGTTGTAAAVAASPNPVVEDTPAAAVPKPGAPDYQGLWETYSGWIDNINRINEGAFSDVRARLSAAGAAPDLIKMQTEHLESQRLSSIENFNKSETFKLLEEGYGVAMGTLENRYEGGMGRYAGAGKPELMDFYTEMYGQPARGAGSGGVTASGGTPSTSASAAANPWFEEPGKVSLIG